MSNQLKKITTRAKQIRRKHPGMAWKSAIKKAGAEYRGGKIGAARKKKSPLKGRKHHHYGKVRSHRRRVNAVNIPAKKHTDYNSPEVNISIGSLASSLKRKYKEKLGKELLRKETATNAKTYRSAAKNIKEIKRKLNQL